MVCVLFLVSIVRFKNAQQWSVYFFLVSTVQFSLTNAQQWPVYIFFEVSTVRSFQNAQQ
jgi:hypothetical protein